MRVVFIGAGTLTAMTARMLLPRAEVVVIERDRERIEALSEELDCGFLHGDGTRPAMLREADPEGTDFLFCLTGNDQTNIIASLVGRSLGFERVITKLEDEELEHICIELGLSDSIIPDNTIARHLADMVAGEDMEELELMIRGDVRLFSFVAREQDQGPLEEVGLPAQSRVVCLYREGECLLPQADTRLREDDEVVLISHRRHLAELRERWGLLNNGNGRGQDTKVP